MEGLGAMSPAQPNAGSFSLAKLDLTGAPATLLFSPYDPDRSVEESYFADWENSRGLLPNYPQRWRICKDGDSPCLEQMTKDDQAMSTGDEYLRDVVIEADIKQIVATSSPGADDEYRAVARTGLFVRARDQRRYYFFCIEGFDRLVLYRREDDAYIMMDSIRMPVSNNVYHLMRLESKGELLTAWFDDRRYFRVFDNVYPAGYCGFRSSGLSRFRRVRVWTGGEAAVRRHRARSDAQAQAAAAAADYPRPCLRYTLDYSQYAPAWVAWADCRGTGRKADLILIPQKRDSDRNEKEAWGHWHALDLTGRILWQRELPLGRLCRTSDLSAGGVEELVHIGEDGFIRSISVRNGNILREAELPKAHPSASPRGSRLKPLFGPNICNLRGTDRPRDILLADDRSGEGAYALWALDNEFRLLWQTIVDQPAYGHHIHCADINADGKDEILAGYHLLNSDGRLLWQMHATQYSDVFQAARHADLAAMGPVGPNGEWRAFVCSGSEGIFLIDLADGSTLAHHRPGHVQGGTVAKYRADLPGLQMWCACRWGNAGIHTLIDGDGRVLARMEPDRVSEDAGVPVNWRGDGEELYLLSASDAALGLWDSHCRRLFDFDDFPQRSALIGSHVLAMDILDDRRDELIFVTDNSVFVFGPEYGNRAKRIQGSAGKIYAPNRGWDRILATMPALPFPAAAPIVSLPGWESA